MSSSRSRRTVIRWLPCATRSLRPRSPSVPALRSTPPPTSKSASGAEEGRDDGKVGSSGASRRVARLGRVRRPPHPFRPCPQTSAAQPGEPHPYDWVLWTIKSEFIGSLAIFALILIFKTRAVRVLVSLLGLALLADGYLGCFLVGLLLHDLGFATCSRFRASARTLDIIGVALAAFGLLAWNLADMLPGMRS